MLVAVYYYAPFYHSDVFRASVYMTPRFSFVLVCDKSLDLTLVIENSPDIGKSQFEKVKTFAKRLVDAFDVKADGTQVAVVSYGSRPAVHVLFDSFTGPELNYRVIKDTIDEIDHQSVGAVSPSSALSEVLDTVYAEGRGARNGTNKVISQTVLGLISV